MKLFGREFSDFSYFLAVSVGVAVIVLVVVLAVTAQ